MTLLAQRPNESQTQRWLREEYERLGGDFVNYRGVDLFPSGHIIDGLASIEPPQAPYERQQLVVVFWEIKVSELEARFNDFKKGCVANAAGGFSDAQRAKLLDFKEQAELPKQKLAAAREALKAVTPYEYTEEAAAERARHAQLAEQRKREALDQINAITF